MFRSQMIGQACGQALVPKDWTSTKGQGGPKGPPCPIFIDSPINPMSIGVFLVPVECRSP